MHETPPSTNPYAAGEAVAMASSPASSGRHLMWAAVLSCVTAVLGIAAFLVAMAIIVIFTRAGRDEGTPAVNLAIWLSVIAHWTLESAALFFGGWGILGALKREDGHLTLILSSIGTFIALFILGLALKAYLWG